MAGCHLPIEQGSDEKLVFRGLIRRWERLAKECDSEVHRSLDNPDVPDAVLAMAGARSVTLVECADDLREMIGMKRTIPRTKKLPSNT